MSRREWTAEESKDLLELYNKLNNEELLRHFGRSYPSIYKKARSLGLYKDPKIEYINRSKSKESEKSASWKGGKTKSTKGYVFILEKKHPRADKNGYVLEHIVIMEKHIGRRITTDEVVHHINGIKDDNRIENLKVMGFGEHTTMHHKGRKHSEETKEKLRKKTLQRFKDITNHPNYKHVDREKFIEMLFGLGPNETARRLSVCRRTVYNKIQQFGIEERYKNVK